MRSSRSRHSIAELAARGAIAGLAGGVAMVAAERLLFPRLADRRAPRVLPWDARVGRAAKQVGVRLTPRRRTQVAISTQLVGAALLGAGYYVARERSHPSSAGEELLEAALAFGISLIAPEPPTKRQTRRGLRDARDDRPLLAQITPPAVFGRTATLALRALAR